MQKSKKSFLVPVYIVIVSLIVGSCNQIKPETYGVKDSLSIITPVLPELVSIAKLPNTEFVLTLESNLEEKKNIIYTPTLLFAWDKLKTLIGSPIVLFDSSSADIKSINNAGFYKNSLNSNEYEAEGTFQNERIVAKAFFNKNLPFTTKFQKLDSGILFGKDKVEGFGINDFNNLLADQTKIIYYKDDDNFIIKLIPKDSSNEILLAKGITNFSNFLQALNKIQKLINQVKNNKETFSDEYFVMGNSLSIPIIHFNIEKHYSTLEKQVFISGNRNWLIDTAYQKTGFIMDENGGMVESEAVIAAAKVDSAASIPKNLIFDKPYLIVIKKTNSSDPYFVMKVENADLMIKSKKQ